MKLFYLFLFLSFQPIIAKPLIGNGTKPQLTLYFFNTPKGINWNSPKDLLFSVLINSLTFKSHSIGHVAVELSCPQNNYYNLTGMTNLEDPYKKDILVHREGFNVIFKGIKGRLENTSDLTTELTNEFKTGERVNFLTIKISDSNCLKLSTYLEEYKQIGEKENFKDWYGLPNRPRYKEGGGCSAFGVSFLEVAGILRPEYVKNWSYFIRVPKSLIGDEENKVGIIKLLTLSKDENRWARETENHRDIFFWDPDAMNSWIKKISAQNDSAPFTKVKFLNSIGLYIDESSIEANNSPIWLK